MTTTISSFIVTLIYCKVKTFFLMLKVHDMGGKYAFSLTASENWTINLLLRLDQLFESYHCNHQILSFIVIGLVWQQKSLTFWMKNFSENKSPIKIKWFNRMPLTSVDGHSPVSNTNYCRHTSFTVYDSCMRDFLLYPPWLSFGIFWTLPLTQPNCSTSRF